MQYIQKVKDARDNGNYDSVVLTEEGSFNFDPYVKMGPGLLVKNETVLCIGDSFHIHSQFTVYEFTHTWYRNQEVILWKNNPYLEVKEPCNYNFRITYS